MKSSTLKRIEKLQLTANLADVPPMCLVDLTTDRDALARFWAGDADVLPEPPDGLPAGATWCVLIAPTLDDYDRFRETVDLDDDDVIAAERAEALAAVTPEPEPERKVASGPIWGWDREGRPVY